MQCCFREALKALAFVASVVASARAWQGSVPSCIDRVECEEPSWLESYGEDDEVVPDSDTAAT